MMGFFSRRDRAGREDEGQRMLNDIVEGRGLLGKMSQSFMGTEMTAELTDALNAQKAMQAATGMPTIRATVTAINDTGQLINFDPVVELSATLPDGSDTTFTTLVPHIQIPRVGDAVLLARNPMDPTSFVYGGLAP